MEGEMTRAGQTISRKHSQDVVDRILRLSRQGLNAGVIAERMAMNHRTVAAIISRNTDTAIPTKFLSLSRKLDAAKAVEIRRRWAAGETKRALAAEFGVAVGTIEQVVNNYAWRGAEALVEAQAREPELPDEAAVQDLVAAGYSAKLLEIADEICADV
jgi:hypothetical protein